MSRLAFDAEEGYMQFTDSDGQMVNQPLLKMSALTNRLLRSINYNKAKDARLRNFAYLSEALNSTNLLKIEKPDDQVPMVYPFWTKDTGLRSKLLEKRVFVARYWPNVMQWTEPQSIEYQLAEQIIPLPVDQRYTIHDMAEILKIIKH